MAVVLSSRSKLEMEELFKRTIPHESRFGTRFVFREVGGYAVFEYQPLYSRTCMRAADLSIIGPSCKSRALWHTQGSPLIPDDLRMVSASEAAAICILSDTSRCAFASCMSEMFLDETSMSPAPVDLPASLRRVAMTASDPLGAALEGQSTCRHRARQVSGGGGRAVAAHGCAAGRAGLPGGWTPRPAHRSRGGGAQDRQRDPAAALLLRAAHHGAAHRAAQRPQVRQLVRPSRSRNRRPAFAKKAGLHMLRCPVRCLHSLLMSLCAAKLHVSELG